MAERRLNPLWQCPECGRTFANRNQVHTCGRGSLDHHFADRPARIRELYDRFVELIETECGPVEVLPEKTRIAFHVRMSFAMVMPRRRWLDGHLVIDRPMASRHVRKLERYGPKSHVHRFRIVSLSELDDDFLKLLRAAYAVGEQRHLTRTDQLREPGDV
jgi:hypothetical protein